MLIAIGFNQSLSTFVLLYPLLYLRLFKSGLRTFNALLQTLATVYPFSFIIGLFPWTNSKYLTGATKILSGQPKSISTKSFTLSAFDPHLAS